MQRIILLLFFLTLAFNQEPSQYSVRNLTVKNGLSQNSITSIRQDSKGFLWIGTKAGLNRYNAYGFEEFKHIPFDSNSLVDSHINEIFQDKQGQVWIGTSNGLDLFSTGTRHFKHIITDIDSNSSNRKVINSIVEDKNNLLWIGTADGILVMDKDFKIRSHYRIKDDLKILDNKVVTDLFIQSNKLWVGTSTGLYQLNLLTSEIKSFQPETDNFYSLSSNQINVIYMDLNGILWIGTDLGLNRYNQFEERFYGYFYNVEDNNSLSSDYITSISSDNAGRMWIGTRAGLNIYNPDLDEFQLYQFKENTGLELNPADFNSVYVDILGTIWLGSVENGLIQLIPHIQSFHLYNSILKPQLTSNQITSVILDEKSRLWIGTNYGLNRISSDRNTRTHFFEEPFNTFSISNDYINDILEDDRGVIWIGTSSGLNYYDDKNSRFLRLPSKELSENEIFALENNNENSIWLSTNSGIATLNTDSLTVRYLEKFKTVQAKRLLFDSKKRLWIGLENQLQRYDLISNQIQQYNHSNSLSSLSNDHILSLHEDEMNQIWIGTRAGLNRYREGTNDFEHIKEVAQLADDQIHQIESEKNGSLWIATNKGLSRISFSDNQTIIKNFDSDDGLQNFAFTSAGFRAKTGEFFFGGNNGLNSFYPNQIKEQPYEVPNIIESIVTNNRTIYIDVDTLSSQIVNLDYIDQVITFNFTSLDFINPDKNQYQYKLDGVDNEWIQSGKTHSVSYSNLLPGFYKFRFKGSNSSFNWNSEGASVSINIKPPYWDTWWFRSIITLGLFLLIFTFVYNRFQRLQEIREIRGRIARDLHDDIGASLTEVTLMSELAQQLKDKKQLDNVLAKIEDVTRGLVSSLGDLVWSIDTKNESLDSLLLRMKDFATDLLARKDIQITYQVIGIKSNQKINHHQKQTVYLIFKEAINNIVKHSNAKKVFVQLKDDRKEFSLTIKDDGTGFVLEKEQTGNGLNNMQIRAKRIGGHINFSVDNGLTILLKATTLSV